jgi:hypothetical protein
MLLSWSLTQDKMLKILEIVKIMLLSWSHWHKPSSLQINMSPKSCPCLGHIDTSQVMLLSWNKYVTKIMPLSWSYWHKPSCLKSI